MNERVFDTEDPERHQFAGIESIHAGGLHVASKLQADIVDGKRKLLFRCNAGESQRRHLAPILHVRVELKETCALAIFQKTFTGQIAGITMNGEMNVVFAGYRPIDTPEIGFVPVRTGIEVMLLSGASLQRKSDSARSLRRAERPLAGLPLEGPE
jgi:hypothetical protein